MIPVYHRNNKRKIAVILLMVFNFQLIYPTVSLALTSGPSQPEVQSFQPAGTSDMVDLFTGDFNYNIPLFELPGPNGGYPFNLSYQSGITMDQEASWVGLGWSMNPGAITRQMRGLPDEFSGDSILTKTSVASSVTVGVGIGGGIELFGSDAALSLSSGLSVYNNNYKGMGYTIDASAGYSVSAKSGMTTGLGLNLSLDSNEGVGINPSLSLGGKTGSVGLGVGYNSHSGLSSVSISADTKGKTPKDKKKKDYTSNLGSATATLSLANPGYTPQISMPMMNIGFSATVKLGGGAEGVYGNGYVKGFYNEQKLKDDKKTIKTKTYGYLNYQNSNSTSDLLDINREKDGMVTKEMPNLAIPSLTYDIYSVTGQGISAMYRPMRNDHGVVHDQEIASSSLDAGAGLDIGIPLHYGGNVSLYHAKSTSGSWKDNNNFASSNLFQYKNADNPYEPWYFKVHGEPSSDVSSLYDQIDGDRAVAVGLVGSGNSVSAGTTIGNKNWAAAAPMATNANSDRKPRNQTIQPITNGQLIDGSSVEVLPMFKIQYIESDSSVRSYDRSQLPKHHLAGLTAVTLEGLRYNYALPAYNTYQEEVSFSVQKPALNSPVNRVNTGNNGGEEPQYGYNGTDKFLRSTKMPPYAHSYLLTSIVGPDYVDVTDDGVTPDDLGYWVKFTYQRKSSSSNPYKWRDPYSKAHYQEGWKTDPRDDRGSFTYGEKELWYLAKAETRSHIAVFKTSVRQDGLGVGQKLQDTDLTGKPVYALDEIDLYSRTAQNNYKIKTVRFEYDYSLCKNVFNNLSNNGKLTLKKVWFEYGSSTRGKLNPYVFTYSANNPDYDPYAYDRWGTYKPSDDSDPLQNIDAPYSLQDPAQKAAIDNYASSWSLIGIQLPSGGTVRLDYETDDYAYVQQQPAMQMTELVDPYTSPGQPLQAIFSLKDDNTKIRFMLEKPLDGTLTSTQQKAEVLKYVDPRGQLSFRIKINLRSAGEDFFEYVSGYADIDFAQPMALEKGTSNKYAYGYFYVKKEKNHHPFSDRTWQHLRTNQPDLANKGQKFEATDDNSARINQIKSMGSVLVQVRQMFQGFNSYCSSKNWGREVMASKSWVRLISPDKIKYGGGLRVRQVSIQDQWSSNEEGIYGQVYEYTTQDENNVTISSGVAAYEPLVGGEENSLRYAKKFTQSVPLRSDNNLYFEYPINESYFPGPQVGYSKVTVTSLAAAYRAGKTVANIALSDGKPLFPQGNNVGFGTSGMTVHEFYTAKDFPVLTDETDKINKPYKLNVAIPFLGSLTISNLTTSQGYSVITNDMHGKQKKVSNYRQDRLGNINPDPISWVKYNYRSDSVVNTNGAYNKVFNLFQDNGDGSLSLAPKENVRNTSASKFFVGQETEFFTDMRQFKDDLLGGGASINTDGIYIIFGLIPIFTVWPNVTKSQTLLRTSVTNKIIFKSGILESTEVYNEGSHVITKNLKWDKQTGVPVLTVVNNDFDAPVFSYNMPAYAQYPGMGAAYQNIGLSFTLNDVMLRDGTNYQFTSSLNDKLLSPGDEILLYADSKMTTPLVRAVYMGEQDGNKVLASMAPLSLPKYFALVTRSGYRNQLSAMVGSITALKDPSVAGKSAVYTKSVIVPAK